MSTYKLDSLPDGFVVSHSINDKGLGGKWSIDGRLLEMQITKYFSIIFFEIIIIIIFLICFNNLF